MMEYTIIIEYAGSKYTAYAPDIPGCVATGATVDEARRSMQEALVLHLAMLREMGETFPTAHSQAAIVQIAC
jgi:predicted RNase H-like HicB family nuclease